jgi:hypothetical protein
LATESGTFSNLAKLSKNSSLVTNFLPASDAYLASCHLLYAAPAAPPAKPAAIPAVILDAILIFSSSGSLLIARAVALEPASK